MDPLTHSYTWLNKFKQCPRSFAHQRIWKDAMPPAKTREQMNGIALHEAVANAIKMRKINEAAMSYTGAEVFSAGVQTLLNVSNKSNDYMLLAERKLAFDRDWNVVLYFARPAAPFLRVDIDVSLTHTKSRTGLIIDWKTGKPGFVDQLQLDIYALAVFLADGWVDNIRMEFRYTKYDKESFTVGRGIIEPVKRKIVQVAEDIDSCRAEELRWGPEQKTVAWPATPSRLACKFCPAIMCAQRLS